MKPHNITRVTVVCIIICLSSLYHPPLVTAQTIDTNLIYFFDNFLDGFSKWIPTRDDAHYWSTTDGQAQAKVDKRMTVTEMVPSDEYWDNSWQNYTYEFDFMPITGVDRNISFGFEDLNNWYEIHFQEKVLNLIRLKDGQVVLRLQKNFTLLNGQKYHFKIVFNQGQIAIWIDDMLVYEIDDWTYNGNTGKIGIKAGTGAAYPTIVQFDNILVTPIEDIPQSSEKILDVPLFKQSNLDWAEDIYDSASSWSKKPTIKRWGCALTSLAMILRYYQIDQLPNGEQLNPASLNKWLRNQPDGYVGQGNLNWLAATRLTRLVSETLGTPKLEYARIESPTIEDVINEIGQDRPVILNIEGHFLVGKGYPQDKSDLLINDPAYKYNLFSQHQTELLSTRNFYPSHTDLSYILLVFPSYLKVNLKHVDGSSIEKLQTFTEVVKDPFDETNQTTPNYTKIELAKPETGNFTIEVSQDNFQKFDIEIYTYDQEANPTLLHQSGLAGSQPITFSLSYQKTGISSITRAIDFKRFRQALLEMKNLHQLQKTYAYLQIDQVAEYGQLAPHFAQGRYIPYLQELLDNFKSKMTENCYQYLVQELAAISD